VVRKKSSQPLPGLEPLIIQPVALIAWNNHGYKLVMYYIK
jgi:hypothetical protein